MATIQKGKLDCEFEPPTAVNNPGSWLITCYTCKHQFGWRYPNPIMVARIVAPPAAARVGGLLLHCCCSEGRIIGHFPKQKVVRLRFSRLCNTMEDHKPTPFSGDFTIKIVLNIFLAFSAAFFEISHITIMKQIQIQSPTEVEKAHNGWPNHKYFWQKLGYSFFVAGLFFVGISYLVS